MYRVAVCDDGAIFRNDLSERIEEILCSHNIDYLCDIYDSTSDLLCQIVEQKKRI